MSVARYKIILAYDGTGFSGSQRQAGARTVQSVLEVALRLIGWSGSVLLLAGRTDRGVHAEGQVVAFDIEWQHPPEKLLTALNSNLPGDMAVRSLEQVANDFHPRYQAVARHYRYQVYCQPVRHPLLDRYAWRVWPILDVKSLQQAAASLVGMHDFASYGSPPHRGGSTYRQVYRANWQVDGDRLAFDIEANAFLYRMVRRLVFIQVACGQGKVSLDELNSSLQSFTGKLPPGIAPACGLSLMEVRY